MAARLSTFILLTLALAPVGARADEASVKTAVEAFLNGPKVDDVRKIPDSDLYEIRVGNEVIYTDEKVTHVFVGNLIETKTRKNLTQARQRELSAVKFADLPLDLAVKTVRGKGRRVIATFEDPNCGYCKQLAGELTHVDDITIYTFLLPILSEDSAQKVRAVWCSSDRAKAWNELMQKNVQPPAASAGCKTPVDQVRQLSEKLRIAGTPTIFLANGQRLPGMVRAKELEELLKTAGVK